jgi:hypothetical protein
VEIEKVALAESQFTDDDCAIEQETEKMMQRQQELDELKALVVPTAPVPQSANPIERMYTL